MKNTTLTILILNYNTYSWMEKVLSSIEHFHLSLSKLTTTVVMADNGSSDGSVEKVRQHFPWVKIVENGQNIGFAAGNNIALRQVTTEYVMMLNSDTEFVAQTNLQAMITYMETHSEVAVMTPRLELTDGSLDMASHRGEPTPWASFCYFSKISKLFPKNALLAGYHQTYKDFTQIHSIDACSGAAMLIRRAAIEKVGYLDEMFFMYGEDLDWCKRFRDAGYKIVYFPESTVIHHKYKSGRKNTDQKLAKKTNTHFYQTMLQYYDKHYQQRYPFFVRWGVQFFIRLKTL